MMVSALASCQTLALAQRCVDAGKEIALTPAQEEVATMFAALLDTDYARNPVFVKNFFHDWQKLLGKVVANLRDSYYLHAHALSLT